MAGHRSRNFGREWFGARLGITATFVESTVIFAQIDGPKVHELESGPSAPFFSLCHQGGTDAGPLSLGIDGQQTEITTLPSAFQIDTAGQRSRIFRDQKFSFGKQGPETLKIDALAPDNRPFGNPESGVN